MKRYPRWPLAVMALPAAVAVWSGWVNLGSLCGFGVVQPLPGIVSWHINTAVTLPVGSEAYGAFALGAWLHSGTPERAKRFARNSAIGSLVLGASAQVAYHLLAASHQTRAPWPVVVLVSSVPVVVLGLGAALSHLLNDDDIGTTGSVALEASEPDTVADTSANAETTPEATRKAVSVSGRSDPERRAKRLLKATPDMSGAELARRLDLPNAKAGQRLKAKVT